MKNIFSIPITFWMLLSISTFGQTSIDGNVLDENDIPVPYATVNLFVANDSTHVQGVMTNDNGHFVFTVGEGDYLIRVTAVGKEAVSIPAVVTSGLSSISLGNIRVNESLTTLDEITIEEIASAYEKLPNGVAVNVKGALSASSSALDVLERSPGVVINRQVNSVAMNGKEGTIVLINGQRCYLSGQELISFLANINAANIEKIELLHTPPANLDAQGNAGVINIVYKRSAASGTTGTADVAAGYGNGLISSTTLAISHASPRSIFGIRYGFNRSGQEQLSFNSRRNLFDNSLTTFNTSSYRDPVQRNHNLNADISYAVTKNVRLVSSVGGFDNKWTMDAKNYAALSTEGSDTSMVVDNHEINHWKNFSTNFQLLGNFKKFQFDVQYDFLHYNDSNPTRYETMKYNANGDLLQKEYSTTTKQTPISMSAVQFNISSFLKSVNVKAGGKVNISSLANRVSVQHFYNDTWITDHSLSSKAAAEEGIFAAYAQADAEISKKMDISGGLRYETSRFAMDDDSTRNVFQFSYHSLFPNLLLQYAFSDSRSFQLSYSRRVNRPAYTDIAPFVIFLDPYTFFTGNVKIKPAFANTLRLDVNAGEFNFALSYVYEENPIARFQLHVDSSSNRQVIMPENFSHAKTGNVSVSMPLRFASYCLVHPNLQLSLTDQYDLSARRHQNINWNMNIAATLRLRRQFVLETTAFYASKSLNGASVTQAVKGLSVGLSKELPDAWGKINLACTDVFNTIKYTSIIKTEPQLYIRNGFDFSQPTFRLSYTYSFGNALMNRNRINAEDERKRVE